MEELPSRICIGRMYEYGYARVCIWCGCVVHVRAWYGSWLDPRMTYDIGCIGFHWFGMGWYLGLACPDLVCIDRICMRMGPIVIMWVGVYVCARF